MAGLFKPKNSRGTESPFWHASWYAPNTDGRMVLRRASTKFRDRKKAMAKAVELERADRLAGERNLTKAQALEILDRILERATGERLRKYTIAGAFQGWLDAKTSGGSAPATIRRYKDVVDKFLDSLGPTGGMGLEHLSTAHLAAFQERQHKGGRTARTVNLAMKTLGQACGSFVRSGYLRDNPAGPIQQLSDDGEGTRQPFTAEELQKLLAAAQGEWRGLILMALYTGARLGDASKMRWEAVDLAEKIIRYKPSKTSRRSKIKELVVPILPALDAWLMEQSAPDDGKAYVFPSLASKGPGGAGGLSQQFGKLMKAAGVTAGVAREKAGKAGRNLTSKSFHSLRHSFNSWLANAGVPQEIRQRILGHASVAMNDGYTHMSPDTLRAALVGVPLVSIQPEADNGG